MASEEHFRQHHITTGISIERRRIIELLEGKICYDYNNNRLACKHETCHHNAKLIQLIKGPQK